jgi:aminopeptidase-like protein
LHGRAAIGQDWIRNESGEKIVDFQRCNLHVVNYSIPVRKSVSLAEVRLHAFTLPEFPDRVPYRMSYYKENWAFWLSHDQLSCMREGQYEVRIDSSLEYGFNARRALYRRRKPRRDSDVLSRLPPFARQ